MQQQASTLRQQKISLFDAKFSANFNEFSLFLERQQEVSKKWLKLK